MSASAMPYWGSPAEVLSILAAITGPSFTAPPVSASTGGGCGGGVGSGLGGATGDGVGVGLGVGDADEDAADEDGGAVIRVDRPTVPPDPSRSVGRDARK